MITWYDDIIKKKIMKANEKGLLAVGLVLKNQMKEMAHIQTGLLKNSMTYQTIDFKSPFGTEKGPKEGRSQPNEDERISRPKKGHVRAGSAVVYANAMNENHHWYTKAIDEFKRSRAIEKIYKAIFRKF